MKKLFASALALIMALTLAACGEDLEDELVDITLESDVEEAELTQDPAEATEGMEVTVSASEVEGYDFVRWIDAESEDELSDERDYTFTVEESVTLEAIYEESDGDGNGDDTYTVDLSSNVSRAELSVSDEGPYEEGDEVTVDAPDLETYNFVRWVDADSDDELSTDRSYTFTVDEDLKLEAVYEDTLSTDERKAQDVVDDASDDPEALDTLMADFTSSDAMTMTLDMSMTQEVLSDPDDPESTETEEVTYDMLVEIETQMVDGERVTKLEMTMTVPDMEESTTITLFMEEGEDATTYTMDAAMILDMLDDEAGSDVREMFAIDGDYVKMAVPHDLEDSDMEPIYDQLKEAFYTEMYGEDYDEDDVPELDEDAMDALIENLESLEDFMSFENLSSHEDFELDMERDGNVAEGTFTLGGAPLRAMAEDMIEEIYTSMEALDENDELEPYEDFKATTEYNLAMGYIESMQIPVSMEYDAEEDSMFIDLGMNTLIENLSDLDESLDAIEDMKMEMTMEKSADLEDGAPEAKDLEVIAEELMKLVTVIETAEYLGGIAEDTDISEGTHTVTELESEGMGHLFDLPFIDPELSEVTIDDTDEPSDYEIELYYAHDESAVFADTSLTLDDIGTLMSEEPSDRDDIETIIALVDDDNFDLYQSIGSILSTMIEESSSDWSDPMPEE
ncbi:MAG: lipoprotein [Bacillota bacterium]